MGKMKRSVAKGGVTIINPRDGKNKIKKEVKTNANKKRSNTG
jgi:hypothetical protein